MAQIYEHEQLWPEPCERYNKLSLVQWCKPTEKCPWGYYASFKIGAEWIDESEALVVTTKRDLEHIDFITMFMECFNSDLALDSLSRIYSINFDEKPIESPALRSVVSPLIVIHFLSVVRRIKTLKKGYIRRNENLTKVKGHIDIAKNERTNILNRRYERVYCKYDEFSVDTAENRLIKKALLFADRMIVRLDAQNCSYGRLKVLTAKCLALFEQVSSDVDIREVQQIKAHKLYSEYGEAVRLAKLILRHYDYSIRNISDKNNRVVPFVLDMSLLYEHYVYGLLYEAYRDKIIYQYKSLTGVPDFLYCSDAFRAILDTKYIPKYKADSELDTYVIRQLSGYARDLKILRRLGVDNVAKESSLPILPCVIIYPTEGCCVTNPFLNRSLRDMCESNYVEGLTQFHKINIPLPTI